MDKQLYTIGQLRGIIGKTTNELAEAMDISPRRYRDIEIDGTNFNLVTANKWLLYMLDELDKLPVNMINWDMVPDFHDLAAMKSTWRYWGIY